MKIEAELRQCFIGESKGLFHMWVKKEHIPAAIGMGKFEVPMGVIEFEDGTLELVNLSRIKFIDNKHAGYIWDWDKEI